MLPKKEVLVLLFGYSIKLRILFWALSWPAILRHTG
jgi:hypothetical protein